MSCLVGLRTCVLQLARITMQIFNHSLHSDAVPNQVHDGLFSDQSSFVAQSSKL